MSSIGIFPRRAYMKLSDSRKLAWKEYGLQNGFPIIFMHGNLNSSKFAPMWHRTQDATRNAGARIIAVDRPGYGDSDFLTNRTYNSWSSDILELADHLKLKKFAVLGFSSGGPNAMACCTKFSPVMNRITALGLFSSDGPYCLIGDGILKKMYGTTNLTYQLAIKRQKPVFEDMRNSYEHMRKKDRKILALDDLMHATKHGLAGPAQDAFLEANDWGFNLKDVQVPTLLWHGKEDDSVPFRVAEYLSTNLGNCIQVKFLDNEVHTMIRRHWVAMLKKLINTNNIPPSNL